MNPLWLQCQENISSISQYPVSSEVIDRESNWPIKSILDQRAKKYGYFLDEECHSSRTFGFSISSGSPNFIYWCLCNNQCFQNWSKEWIYYLRIHWGTLSEIQQVAFLEQHVDRNENGNKYFLPAENNRVAVCKSFFTRVLHIGNYKLGRLLQYGNKSPVKAKATTGVGKWDRHLVNFKGKIDIAFLREWIEAQPKSLSHFTRNKSRKQLWYFTEVTGFRELYRKYKNEMIEIGQKYISSTSFFYKLKREYPNFKFHPPILDACPTCLELHQLHQKSTQQSDKALVMRLVCKHQDEADGRYARWRKDRSHVSPNLSKEECDIIVHRK